MDNSSSLACTFNGLEAAVVGFRGNGVFCELPSSFPPGSVSVGLTNALREEISSGTVPFLFERPLEVIGSINVTRVSHGLQVRVPVQFVSSTMEVSCRFGSMVQVKASVMGSVATCFLSECRTEVMTIELSNEGSIWIGASRFRCNFSVSIVSVRPVEISVGQVSVVTLVGQNMLQSVGSLFVEVLQEFFPCVSGVLSSCQLSIQSVGLQRMRVYHGEQLLYECDLFVHERIHLVSINPSVGSVSGGLPVSIYGSGFSRSSSILARSDITTILLLQLQMICSSFVEVRHQLLLGLLRSVSQVIGATPGAHLGLSLNSLPQLLCIGLSPASLLKAR